ncbi:MAG TPA: WD40 repeat domain-containing protein [Planctomycetaceae bacterium]|nr:WD40 repeat domain-containing protein [Planctomycetaceae bacterium]
MRIVSAQRVTTLAIVFLMSLTLNQAVGAGEQPRILKGHSAAVIAVAFSPDGQTLASASAADTIKLWDVQSGALRRTLYGNSGDISAIVFSCDGKILASGGDNGEVTLWELETGQACTAPSGDAAKVIGVAFAPHDACLAAAGADRTIRLWNPKSGKLKATLEGHARGVFCVAFSTDGKRLASGSVDGNAKVWNLERDCEAVSTALRQRTARGPVVSLDFSPDGRDLAIATRDVVEIWDVVSSERRIELPKRPKGSFWWGARYSNQGKLIAIGSGAKYERGVRVSTKGVSTGSFRPEDRVIRLWDVKTGQEIVRLAGHHDSVRAVALSPDGTLLASGSRDKTVRIWSLDANRAPSQDWSVRQVAASNDAGGTAPPLLEDEIGLSSRPQCLKELELLTQSASLDPSTALEAAGGEQAEPPSAETPPATSEDYSPWLSDALSVILDKVIKEPATGSNAGRNKNLSRDFNDRFHFESAPVKSSVVENGEQVVGFSSKTSGASSGGKAASGWDVFRSTPVQSYGHPSSATSSGSGSSSLESSHSVHFEAGRGDLSGASHGDHEEHQKK